MDARRLLAALIVTALLVGAVSHVLYRGSLAQSATAVGGLAILLALAIGVAWASERKRVSR
jgi:hypothetical protein